MNITIKPKSTFTVSIDENFVRDYTALELGAIAMWLYAVRKGITSSPLLIKGDNTYCNVVDDQNAFMIEDMLLLNVYGTTLINHIDTIINSNPLNNKPIIPDLKVFHDNTPVGIFRLFESPNEDENSFICFGLNNLIFNKRRREVITDEDEYYNGKLFSLSPIGLAYSTDLECFYPIRGVPHIPQFGQNTFKFEDFSLSQQ